MDGRGSNWNTPHNNQQAFKPRLQFPTFSSKDPISWLNRANLFFKSQDMSSKEKVEYTAYYLEGEASHWRARQAIGSSGCHAPTKIRVRPSVGRTSNRSYKLVLAL